MAVTLEMPDSVDSGSSNAITDPGVYQVTVLEVSETPTKESDGSLIPNAAFSADIAVVPGVGPMSGRQKKIVFFNPDPAKGKESNAYQIELRKQRRFLEACNVVAERVAGGSTYSVDVTKAKGQTLVMEFSKDERNPKYIQLHYANIYHIDDPDPAAKCERNPELLKIIPPKFRRDPKSFEKDKAKASGNGAANGGGGNKAPANQQQQPVGAAAGVDMNDI